MFNTKPFLSYIARAILLKCGSLLFARRTRVGSEFEVEKKSEN